MKGACGAGAQGSIHFGPEWSAADGAAGAHETRVGYFALSTPDGKPKDTTGAGDCFRGSYVAARYADGKGVAESLRWAAAAASLACEVEGAMVSMPDRASICERLEGPMVGAPRWRGVLRIAIRVCGCSFIVV